MARHLGKIKPCIILPSFLHDLARSCKVVKVRIDMICSIFNLAKFLTRFDKIIQGS